LGKSRAFALSLTMLVIFAAVVLSTAPQIIICPVFSGL
jgi:hypothetical protein